MKEQLYMQAFINTNKKAIENRNYTHDDIKKLVFYGIKYANTQCSNDITIFEKSESLYNFVRAISIFTVYLTPNDFINMFPLKKGYCSKDMGAKNKKIDADLLVDFLYEFPNDEVRMFSVMLIKSLDRLRGSKCSKIHSINQVTN